VTDRSQDAPSPFDLAAANYDRTFTGGTLARLQRDAVWRRLEVVLRPGMRVLELGCGTGEDAVRLAERGIAVVATDVSTAMLEHTRQKAAAAGVTDLVTTRRLDLSEIERMLPATGAAFDAALSNFGPLNCVADRRAVGRALARALPAGAPLVLVVLGALCPWEIGWYLLRVRPRTALRRFHDGRPAQVDGGGWIRVWYPSPRALQRELGPWFRSVRIEGLGVLNPPPALEDLARRWPAAVRGLDRLERRLACRWPLSRFGDHTLLELVRTDVDVEPT
jgi:ubiquinone/menaquinone biosynthesis C-methylase UbiE